MRTTALFLIPVTALAFLAACSPGSDDTSRTGDAPRTATGDTARRDTGITGAASEEEFKAMHQLRGDQAPAARGTMIDLAGSRAYLSLPPEAAAPMPGLIVIHEWWGLNDHIKHWSDRLAADGYATLAVDLFGGKVADNPDSAMAFTKSVDEAQAFRILAAADTFLASDPRIRARKRGSIGWCFGGAWSLQAALRQRDLDACVIYYGRLVTSAGEFRGLRTPVLGHFANRDRSITPEMVDRFETALNEAGVPHEIHRYDADHAFANPSGGNYDEPAAAQAWERTRAFLSAHLEQGSGTGVAK